MEMFAWDGQENKGVLVAWDAVRRRRYRWGASVSGARHYDLHVVRPRLATQADLSPSVILSKWASGHVELCSRLGLSEATLLAALPLADSPARPVAAPAQLRALHILVERLCEPVVSFVAASLRPAARGDAPTSVGAAAAVSRGVFAGVSSPLSKPEPPAPSAVVIPQTVQDCVSVLRSLVFAMAVEVRSSVIAQRDAAIAEPDERLQTALKASQEALHKSERSLQAAAEARSKAASLAGRKDEEALDAAQLADSLDARAAEDEAAALQAELVLARLNERRSQLLAGGCTFVAGHQDGWLSSFCVVASAILDASTAEVALCLDSLTARDTHVASVIAERAQLISPLLTGCVSGGVARPLALLLLAADDITAINTLVLPAVVRAVTQVSHLVDMLPETRQNVSALRTMERRWLSGSAPPPPNPVNKTATVSSALNEEERFAADRAGPMPLPFSSKQNLKLLFGTTEEVHPVTASPTDAFSTAIVVLFTTYSPSGTMSRSEFRALRRAAGYSASRQLHQTALDAAFRQATDTSESDPAPECLELHHFIRFMVQEACRSADQTVHMLVALGLPPPHLADEGMVQPVAAHWLEKEALVATEPAVLEEPAADLEAVAAGKQRHWLVDMERTVAGLASRMAASHVRSVAIGDRERDVQPWLASGLFSSGLEDYALAILLPQEQKLLSWEASMNGDDVLAEQTLPRTTFRVLNGSVSLRNDPLLHESTRWVFAQALNAAEGLMAFDDAQVDALVSRVEAAATVSDSSDGDLVASSRTVELAVQRSVGADVDEYSLDTSRGDALFWAIASNGPLLLEGGTVRVEKCGDVVLDWLDAACGDTSFTAPERRQASLRSALLKLRRADRPFVAAAAKHADLGRTLLKVLLAHGQESDAGSDAVARARRVAEVCPASSSVRALHNALSGLRRGLSRLRLQERSGSLRLARSEGQDDEERPTQRSLLAADISTSWSDTLDSVERRAKLLLLLQRASRLGAASAGSPGGHASQLDSVWARSLPPGVLDLLNSRWKGQTSLSDEAAPESDAATRMVLSSCLLYTRYGHTAPPRVLLQCLYTRQLRAVQRRFGMKAFLALLKGASHSACRRDILVQLRPSFRTQFLSRSRMDGSPRARLRKGPRRLKEGSSTASHHYSTSLAGISVSAMSAVQGAWLELFLFIGDLALAAARARDAPLVHCALASWMLDLEKQDHEFLLRTGLVPALAALFSLRSQADLAEAALSTDTAAASSPATLASAPMPRWRLWPVEYVQRALSGGTLTRWELVMHMRARGPTPGAEGEEWWRSKRLDRSAKDLARQLSNESLMKLYTEFAAHVKKHGAAVPRTPRPAEEARGGSPLPELDLGPAIEPAARRPSIGAARSRPSVGSVQHSPGIAPRTPASDALSLSASGMMTPLFGSSSVRRGRGVSLEAMSLTPLLSGLAPPTPDLSATPVARIASADAEIAPDGEGFLTGRVGAEARLMARASWSLFSLFLARVCGARRTNSESTLAVLESDLWRGDSGDGETQPAGCTIAASMRDVLRPELPRSGDAAGVNGVMSNRFVDVEKSFPDAALSGEVRVAAVEERNEPDGSSFRILAESAAAAALMSTALSTCEGGGIASDAGFSTFSRGLRELCLRLVLEDVAVAVAVIAQDVLSPMDPAPSEVPRQVGIIAGIHPDPEQAASAVSQTAACLEVSQAELVLFRNLHLLSAMRDLPGVIAFGCRPGPLGLIVTALRVASPRCQRLCLQLLGAFFPFVDPGAADCAVLRGLSVGPRVGLFHTLYEQMSAASSVAGGAALSWLLLVSGGALPGASAVPMGDATAVGALAKQGVRSRSLTCSGVVIPRGQDTGSIVSGLSASAVSVARALVNGAPGRSTRPWAATLKALVPKIVSASTRVIERGVDEFAVEAVRAGEIESMKAELAAAGIELDPRDVGSAPPTSELALGDALVLVSAAGMLSVLGGLQEPLRVGARVVTRSQLDQAGPFASQELLRAHHAGTLVRFSPSMVLVPVHYGSDQGVQLVSVSQLTPVDNEPVDSFALENLFVSDCGTALVRLLLSCSLPDPSVEIDRGSTGLDELDEVWWEPGGDLEPEESKDSSKQPGPPRLAVGSAVEAAVHIRTLALSSLALASSNPRVARSIVANKLFEPLAAFALTPCRVDRSLSTRTLRMRLLASSLFALDWVVGGMRFGAPPKAASGAKVLSEAEMARREMATTLRDVTGRDLEVCVKALEVCQDNPERAFQWIEDGHGDAFVRGGGLSHDSEERTDNPDRMKQAEELATMFGRPPRLVLRALEMFGDSHDRAVAWLMDEGGRYLPGLAIDDAPFSEPRVSLEAALLPEALLAKSPSLRELALDSGHTEQHAVIEDLAVGNAEDWMAGMHDGTPVARAEAAPAPRRLSVGMFAPEERGSVGSEGSELSGGMDDDEDEMDDDDEEDDLLDDDVEDDGASVTSDEMLWTGRSPAEAAITVELGTPEIPAPAREARLATRALPSVDRVELAPTRVRGSEGRPSIHSRIERTRVELGSLHRALRDALEGDSGRVRGQLSSLLASGNREVEGLLSILGERPREPGVSSVLPGVPAITDEEYEAVGGDAGFNREAANLVVRDRAMAEGWGPRNLDLRGSQPLMDWHNERVRDMEQLWAERQRGFSKKTPEPVVRVGGLRALSSRTGKPWRPLEASLGGGFPVLETVEGGGGRGVSGVLLHKTSEEGCSVAVLDVDTGMNTVASFPVDSVRTVTHVLATPIHSQDDLADLLMMYSNSVARRDAREACASVLLGLSGETVVDLATRMGEDLLALVRLATNSEGVFDEAQEQGSAPSQKKAQEELGFSRTGSGLRTGEGGRLELPRSVPSMCALQVVLQRVLEQEATALARTGLSPLFLEQATSHILAATRPNDDASERRMRESLHPHVPNCRVRDSVRFPEARALWVFFDSRCCISGRSHLRFFEPGRGTPVASFDGGSDEWKPFVVHGSELLFDFSSEAGSGGVSWGYRFFVAPMSGLQWLTEADTLSQGSLEWGSWALEFLLRDAPGLVAQGVVHSRKTFGALVDYLRARGSPYKHRIINLLIRLLKTPHLFDPDRRPDLSALRGMERSVMRHCESTLSRSRGALLPPRLLQVVELLTTARSAQRLFASSAKLLENEAAAAASASAASGTASKRLVCPVGTPLPLKTDAQLLIPLPDCSVNPPSESSVDERQLADILMEAMDLIESVFGHTRLPDSVVIRCILDADASIKDVSRITPARVSQVALQLARWTREQDQELVQWLTTITSASRRARIEEAKASSAAAAAASVPCDSGTGKASTPLELDPCKLLIDDPDDIVLFPQLTDIPIDELRERVSLLQQLNRRLVRAMPLLDVMNVSDEYSLGFKLQQLNHCIFYEPKLSVLKAALAGTATARNGMSATLNFDNSAAFESREAALRDPSRRSAAVYRGPFIQAFQQLGKVPAKQFRANLNHHECLFTVRLQGEPGIDQGGLFRDVFTRIIEDALSPHLDLFLSTANARRGVGSNMDKFVPNPKQTAPEALAMFEFLGRFLGVTIRHSLYQPFDFAPIVWKLVGGEAVDKLDLAGIDAHTVRFLDQVAEARDEEAFASLGELRYTVEGASGEPIDLFPGSSSRVVEFADRTAFAAAAVRARIQELEAGALAIRRGLESQIPARALRLFTWQELEQAACGDPYIRVEVLRSNSTYAGGFDEHHPVVQRFWRVFASMSNVDRGRLIKFAWGRSRLPKPGEWKTKFKLSPGPPKDHLPLAHVCFAHIELPLYETDEEMRSKLLAAATHGSGGEFLMA
jgi:hypothetical protein